ncbi:MAG: O-antigen ligase family protein, partial [Gammaproteobacteria bacterium]|nr:O-antigen ligase family protein [Gammaproteobacteria bacterium]
MSPALLVTYLISYGGALIAPFLPFIGVCMYISLSIIKPTKTWFWAVPDGSYSKIVIIAVILGWVIKRFGNWDFGKAKLIVVCFAAFIAWSFMSTLMIDEGSQERAIDFVVLMLKVLLPFLIVMTLIDSVEKLKMLAWCIVISLGLVALEENLYYLSMGFVRGMIGMNAIAHEMTAGFGLAVFLGLYSEKNWQKWLSWSIAGLIAHVSFMCMSRGAMLGLLITGIIIAYKMPKNRQTISLTIFAIFSISILAGPSVVQEFSTIFAAESVRDNSAQSRLDLWADMFTVALSNPLFGIGPSQWQLIAVQFGWPDGKQGHGMWVQFFAE